MKDKLLEELDEMVGNDLIPFDHTSWAKLEDFVIRGHEAGKRSGKIEERMKKHYTKALNEENK